MRCMLPLEEETDGIVSWRDLYRLVARVRVEPKGQRHPSKPIPEDGTPDLFEDLQNLPATPTPPTDQSMATSLS